MAQCAAGVEVLHWRRLVQGDAVKLEEAVDVEVKMVGWRWQGGRNHKIIWEVFFSNKAGHYLY